ncbi:TetR/AcrR family transcriptional regulator [Nocardia gipuzkoensis]|uniref:TetR/AcrR family transcriptional regulator n=1 Tax=Nocardia gipuzkoensis TaxID=2749991 RepID=UPI0015EF281B|nr:TetR/AcrR family transcriptional regulator [Nocardia gipuzkoensis]
MRSHAQRNYSRILAAATAVFAESGPDASLNEVARRAGVGPGTLYRHFSNRQALHLAVLQERIEVLCGCGEDLLSAPDAGAALGEWLRALLLHARNDRGLGAAALTGPIGLNFECREAIERTAAKLLARAQRAGTVRTDTSADDLIQLVAGIALAAADSSDADQADRLLGIAVDGITTH